MKALLPLLMSAVVFTAACDDNDEPVGPSTSIGVTLGQMSATVAPGGSTSIPVTLTRSGGFTGTVNLSAENLPTGVTAVFAPATVTNPTTASTLTITAANTATAGTNNITIRAAGSGVSARTITLPVTVGAVSNGITLFTTAATASGIQGTTTTIPVVITRTGSFTGDVTLAAEGLPTGVTAAFSPATITAGQRVSTLTLTTAGTATAGTQNIMIRGSGTGIGAQTQTIAYTVGTSTTSGFGFSSAPSALTVTAGQSITSTMTISRQNSFAGTVALVAEGAPTGMTVTFGPNPATAATSTVTVTTTTATAPGVYNITVRGTSTGATERSQVITVVVNAPAA